MIIFSLLLSLIQLVVVAGALYYYFLLFASIPNPRLTESGSVVGRDLFAVLIPAHNEAVVIGDTVRYLTGMAYPEELFDIVVVADYCDDNTADVVREAGGICYERNEGERGRKGFALAWLVERVLSSPRGYDAIVILDADSQTNAQFLTVMGQALTGGAQAIQGQHIISDYGLSIYNRLAAVDMRLNNRLRNRAKHNLGLSCRLMGDAMCFSTDLMRKHKWNTFSLVEDMEFGIHLLLNDTHVVYAQDAISYGQAAGGWQQASTQRLRWSGGFLDLRRRLGLNVFGSGIKRLDPALIDRGIELLLPAYSTLALMSLAIVFIQLVFPDLPALLGLPVMILTAAAWFLLPLLGILLDRAPWQLTAAYFLGPVFIMWRLWIGVLTFVRRKHIDWVRTPRQEET